MSTITADTPTTDKVTTAVHAGHEAAHPLGRLWQVPVFLAGVAALATVWLDRPRASEVTVRQLDRELASARQILSRADGDAKAALNHAHRAIKRAERFPDRLAEAHFLAGSAEARLADRVSALEAEAFWKSARLHFEEADRLGVKEEDRGRLKYRLARTLYYLGEETQRVAEQLAASVDSAEDRAEAYRLLAEAYLRLPSTPANLEAALAANDKLRMVQPLAPDLQALAQLQAGELNLRLGKAEAARKVLEKIGPQAPASLLARKRAMCARSFQTESRWQDAAEQWKQLLGDEREPLADRGAALYNLGVCQAHLNLPLEAAPCWEECLKVGTGPEVAAAALALADVYLHGPTPEKAMGPLSRLVEGIANFGQLKNPLVDPQLVRERFEQAVQKYRETAHPELALQCLDLYERVAEAGRTSLLRGDATAEWARARQTAARQLPPGEARTAEEEAVRQLFRSAAEAYLKAADKLQDEAREEAVWLGAMCRLDAQDDRPAIDVLNRYLLIGKNPERLSEAWFRLGECHRRNRSLPLAEEAYQKCIQQESSIVTRMPFEFRARYQLALLMIADGRLDEAEAELESNIAGIHTRGEADQETRQKSFFALGGLLFQRKNYREVAKRLREVLSVEAPPTTPEGTRARFQFAESCRQLADEEQRKLFDGNAKAPVEVEHIQSEHRRYLKEATDEYEGLADFLDATESQGQLTEVERIQVSFMSAICRFNLGDYEQALKTYERLASRFAFRPVPPEKTPPETVVKLYPQFRLEALAGVIRSLAALGKSDEMRKRLLELREILPEVDEPIRIEYEKWLRIAAKSVETP